MVLKRLKIATNFYLDEFHCKDGTLVPAEFHTNVFTLAKDLQVIRDYFREPITITSAYRTQDHNHKVGGAVGSWHLKAKAVDLKVRNVQPVIVAIAIQHLMLTGKISKGGLGVYGTFVHYDHRGSYHLFKL